MELKKIIQRHPAAAYFILTFTISWIGAFLVVASKVFSGQRIPQMDGILMFPIMIVGPAAASIILTKIIDGNKGLRQLWSQIFKIKISNKRYLLALLIPPGLIIMVVCTLTWLVSPAFTPNFFPFGLFFGVPAGFFEEIGWTGFALPALLIKLSPLKTAIIMGFIWGLWHLPVIDFLGAASPHGDYLLPFAVAFIAAMAAIRVLIVWVFSKTNNVIVAQLMHVISTGSLVVLGPSTVSSGQEAFWYSFYAISLWVTVLIIAMLEHKKPGSTFFMISKIN